MSKKKPQITRTEKNTIRRNDALLKARDLGLNPDTLQALSTEDVEKMVRRYQKRIDNAKLDMAIEMAAGRKKPWIDEAMKQAQSLPVAAPSNSPVKISGNDRPEGILVKESGL